MSNTDFSVSAVSNQLQTNLSLASVHFDFSFIKVEPPSEYGGVGKSLSKKRNEEAETGQSHATASKLGVFFEGIVPHVPNLISAYGSRCSEVAKNRDVNPSGTKKHGVFASQVGADGTNIWAAATSGPSALAVNLLACMLTKIWDSPKAISIWMELIFVRREILASSGRTMDLPISQIPFTREEIASWDASARAWRLSADQANELRQTQLSIIIDNLGMPVSPKFVLYESVIDAWTSAMITVDKLISGESQSVHTGAPLLGLASWHIYPDMFVFGKGKNKEVKQNDPLVDSGGILTLGIEDVRHQGKGIYWSLPLAHLRYYGDPVVCKSTLHSDNSRVSLDKFIYVTLGCLIRRWIASAKEIDDALRLLVQIHNQIYASKAVPYIRENVFNWLELLGCATQNYLDSKMPQKHELLQLINYGRRVYHSFIDDPKSNSIFGFSQCKTFFSMLPDNNARVMLLRRIAEDFTDDRKLMIIQCESEWQQSWERSVELHSVIKHLRSPGSIHPEMESYNYILWFHGKRDQAMSIKGTEKIELQSPIPNLGGISNHWGSVPPEFYNRFLDLPEYWQKQLSDTGTGGATVRSRFLFGDLGTAALYSISIDWWTMAVNVDSRTLENKKIRSLPNILVLKHLTYAFNQKLPDAARLHDHLNQGNFSNLEVQSRPDQAILKSLRAIITVWKLYQWLPHATVELKVAHSPLWSHKWIPDHLPTDNLPSDLPLNNALETNHLPCYNFRPYALSQEATFACIAKFESGTFNFTPSSMVGVLAISSGNSLFVARTMLQDPCETTYCPIDRVIGNVGKPGMVILVSTERPRVRPESDYTLVHHSSFDAQEENSFEHTNLHMTLTDW
jgi:hypothetical protein